MKKRILLSAILVAMTISGCSSLDLKIPGATKPTAQSNAQISSQLTKVTLDNIMWNKILLPYDEEIAIGTATQELDPSLFNSVGPVLAYQIPLTYGAMVISLDTYIQDANLFATNMVLLDQDNNVILEQKFDEFTYQAGQLMIPDLLGKEFTYIPTKNITEVKLLIYTTKNDIISTTEYLHPAKAFARAHNNAEPDIKDPVAHHSFRGNIALDIDSRQLQVLSAAQPAVQTSSNVQFSENYYESAIRTAVKEDNLGRAIQLRDEARDLGIAGMDKVFIDAIKNSQ